MSALDTAIYWSEYVIRHKGAPHLRSASRDLCWYQYLLLDVSAVLVSVAVLLALAIFYVTKSIIGFVLHCRKSQMKKNQ
jgi:glucuronosyltransferase